MTKEFELVSLMQPQSLRYVLVSLRQRVHKGKSHLSNHPKSKSGVPALGLAEK